MVILLHHLQYQEVRNYCFNYVLINLMLFTRRKQADVTGHMQLTHRRDITTRNLWICVQRMCKNGLCIIRL